MQGPNNAGEPYIYIEFRSLKTFDKKEDCHEMCPKLFEAVTKVTGLPKERVHIMMGPCLPFQVGWEGSILG